MTANRKRQGFLFPEQVATKLQQLAEKRCLTMTSVLTQMILDEHKREFPVRKQYETQDQRAHNERMARLCYTGQTFEFGSSEKEPGHHWHVGADGQPAWGPWLYGPAIQGVYCTYGEAQDWCRKNSPPPSDARVILVRGAIDGEPSPRNPADYDLYYERKRLNPEYRGSNPPG